MAITPAVAPSQILYGWWVGMALAIIVFLRRTVSLAGALLLIAIALGARPHPVAGGR